MSNMSGQPLLNLVSAQPPTPNSGNRRAHMELAYCCDEDATAAWDAQIERRVAELNCGAVKSVPWSEVRQRLMSRLKPAIRGAPC